MSVRFRIVTLVIALLAAGEGRAHTPGSSHLAIDLRHDEPASVTPALAIVDLAQVVAIDGDDDGRVTWGEVRAARPAIAGYVRERLSIERGGTACELAPRPHDTAMIRYGGVEHVSLPFRLDCRGGGAYTMRYGLFFDIDPQHRAIATVLADGEQVIVLSDGSRDAAFGAGGGSSGMFREGVRHILIGYDHLLFLLLLVLPLAVARRATRRSWRLAGVVTAFTAAHSVTLALATTGVVTLPGKPVEVAIALSIVAAAGVNVFRPGHRVGWQLAFGFGLLHGFGFAGALAELGLESGSLFRNLLLFNAGVEAGQLLVVAAALPLLMIVTRWAFLERALVPALSAAGAVTGLLWTAARLG